MVACVARLDCGLATGEGLGEECARDAQWRPSMAPGWALARRGLRGGMCKGCSMAALNGSGMDTVEGPWKPSRVDFLRLGKSIVILG